MLYVYIYIYVCENEFRDYVPRRRFCKRRRVHADLKSQIDDLHLRPSSNRKTYSFHSNRARLSCLLQIVLCVHPVDTPRSRSSICPEIHGASPDRRRFSGPSTRANPPFLRTSRRSCCTVSWCRWSLAAGVFPRVRSLAISVTKNAKRRRTRPWIPSPHLGCNASCS